MTRRLPFQDHALDYALQRARHRREAGPDCKCVLCATVAENYAAIMARVEAERAKLGPPPF